MTHVNQKKLAEMLGVSANAISKAVKSGRLIRDRKGIELDHPLTIDYTRSHLARTGKTLGQTTQQRDEERACESETTVQATGKPAERGVYQTKNTADGDRGERLLNAAELAKELNNRLKELKIEKETHAQGIRTKKIAPAPILTRAFSRLGSVLQENFRAFDERYAEEIYARVLAGCGPDVVADILRRGIDSAVSNVIAIVIREIEQLRPIEIEGKDRNDANV